MHFFVQITLDISITGLHLSVLTFLDIRSAINKPILDNIHKIILFHLQKIAQNILNSNKKTSHTFDEQ